MQHLTAFLALSALLVLAPGPDTAIVTKNALQHGRAEAIRASFGVCAGLLCWTVAAAIGIAALLRTSARVFDALRLAGAVYLVFLGAQAIVSSLRDGRSRRPDTDPAAAASITKRADADAREPRAFRQGLLSNLLNPKIGVFFTSFLPQFVAPGAPVLGATVLLGFLFALIALSWLLVYCLLATRLGDVLRRPPVRRWLERVTGAVLIGFGLRLALDRR